MIIMSSSNNNYSIDPLKLLRCATKNYRDNYNTIALVSLVY